MESQKEKQKVLLEKLDSVVKLKVFTDNLKGFVDSKDRLEKAAENWLKASIILIVLAFIFAWYGAHYYNSGDYHKLIGQAVLVSMIIATSSWCAKNHRRNRHNALTAGHRATTLSSFVDLYRTLDSKDSNREVILMKALDSVFQPIPTGYAAEEAGSEGASGLQILEVIKSIKSP